MQAALLRVLRALGKGASRKVSVDLIVDTQTPKFEWEEWKQISCKSTSDKHNFEASKGSAWGVNISTAEFAFRADLLGLKSVEVVALSPKAD
jgi:hypothetical protein